MTKRASLIDKILAALDAKIAELQRSRQNLIDMRAELDTKRRQAPTTAATRRKPAAPPAAQP